jgi:cell division protein FtsQ
MSSGLSVHIDERWPPSGKRPGERAPRSAKPVRRLLIRWPGPLRSNWFRRAIGAALCALVLLIAVALFPGKQIAAKMLAWSGRAGFQVVDIFVEGRAKTPRDQLLNALAIKRGDAIFAIDLDAARRRLEEIPWVRTASVERRLPNDIHILITERSPIVLWQNKGRYFLVDHDGQVVGDQIDDYADLPLTVGEGAPDHAAALVALLDSEPALKSRVKAATWIGDRRWNVTLDRAEGGIEVRLPEENPDAAWHDLARLEKEQSLLERQIGVIDMRLPDRLVLRAANAPKEQAAGAGKHKILAGKDA